MFPKKRDDVWSTDRYEWLKVLCATKRRSSGGNNLTDSTINVGAVRRFGPIAVATLAICCVVWLHLWQLDTPLPLFKDEASIAYNAYCIAKTGADEYGIRLPFSFRAFDNYHDPVLVYSLVPLIGAKRIESQWIRLPSAVFFLAAMAIVGILAGDYTRSRWVGICVGVGFGLLPWTFALSRSAMGGYTPMLFGMAVGWLGLTRAATRRSFIWAAFAGLGWALAMYSHHTGRPMTAVLLLAFVVSYGKSLWRRKETAAVFVAVFLLALTPLTLSAFFRSEFLTSRFSRMAIWSDGPILTTVVQRFVDRYVAHFGPQFLFVRGDPVPMLHSGFGGELFKVMAPLVLIGIWRTASRRRPAERFVLLGTAVYPLAAALTLDPVHASRSINGAPFWCILAAIGARTIWQATTWRRATVCVLCTAVAIEAGAYLRDYFGSYRDRAVRYFEVEFQEALQVGFDLTGSQTLLIDHDSLPWPVDVKMKPILYAHVLYWGWIDPAEYQLQGLPPQRVKLTNGDGVLESGIYLCRDVVVARSKIAGRFPSDAMRLAEAPIRDDTLKYEALVREELSTEADLRAPTAELGRRYELWRIP